jgi:hypothetical protein
LSGTPPALQTASATGASFDPPGTSLDPPGASFDPPGTSHDPPASLDPPTSRVAAKDNSRGLQPTVRMTRNSRAA